jgi:hypothetical protein
MILTDSLHLVSTKSLQELHEFARRIRLSREWFQNHHIPHYDLFGTKRLDAVEAGARLVTARQLVRRAIRREALRPWWDQWPFNPR